jgi:apolipoprotein N-acyltransferase
MTPDGPGPFLGRAVLRADSSFMERRLLVGWLTAFLVVAWGMFALSYASSPPTEGLLGLSVIVGVTFTCVAAYLIGVAWTQGKTAPAITITLVATVVVLFLALLPHWSLR